LVCTTDLHCTITSISLVLATMVSLFWSWRMSCKSLMILRDRYTNILLRASWFSPYYSQWVSIVTQIAPSWRIINTSVIQTTLLYQPYFTYIQQYSNLYLHRLSSTYWHTNILKFQWMPHRNCTYTPQACQYTSNMSCTRIFGSPTT
jgi:hypothetical protein